MHPIISTAGWSIPTHHASAFPPDGTALQRYASRFRGVEINSSFHRPHRPSTWARWGESVPDDFLFSVKLPKTITHGRTLVGCEEEAAAFLRDSGALGPKLAILLVQLPPSLAFDASVAGAFFALIGSLSAVQMVCEPRHPSWFEEPADALMRAHQVARVAADPARVPAAAMPGGWPGLAYWRLHGSPVIYRSAYGPDRVADYAAMLAGDGQGERPVWCMFDNTASSAATGDALTLARLFEEVA